MYSYVKNILLKKKYFMYYNIFEKLILIYKITDYIFLIFFNLIKTDTSDFVKIYY